MHDTPNAHLIWTGTPPRDWRATIEGQRIPDHDDDVRLSLLHGDGFARLVAHLCLVVADAQPELVLDPTARAAWRDEVQRRFLHAWEGLGLDGRPYTLTCAENTVRAVLRHEARRRG